MFTRTTAINKILAMTARKKVVQGSTSSGKTYGIIPIEIDYSIKHPKTLTTFVAESIPAVKRGCVRIFKDVMQDTNRWRDDHWLGSPMQYEFSNGSIIEFTSFPTISSAKSAGKRDRLFINEANHIPHLIADALMVRSKSTTLDFNPDNEFWAHTEVLTEPESELLTLTYLDNEACPEEIIADLLAKTHKAFFNPSGDWNDPDNIKNTYWANWCRVYVRGEMGRIEGVIFSNYKVIDSIPKEARLLGLGLDFGYSNDPTAIVEVYKYNDQRVLNEICYQKGLTNSQISKRIEGKTIVYCDSAEPKSITELRLLGKNATGAKKGKDSINFGIQLMQEQDYLVTSKSSNLINELRRYSWDKDRRTNETLNKPIDDFNHALDAVRYHEIMSIKQNDSGIKFL